MSNPPREASADVRAAAAQLRAMYLALCQEGFTAQEALAIIGHCLASNSK